MKQTPCNSKRFHHTKTVNAEDNARKLLEENGMSYKDMFDTLDISWHKVMCTDRYQMLSEKQQLILFEERRRKLNRVCIQ